MESKAPVLKNDENGLTLTDGTLSLRGDFTESLPRLTRSNLQRELLLRAAGCKGGMVLELSSPPVAVDATAGLGEDSLLLAAAGFQVQLFERDAVIAALLKDALRRAREDPRLSEVAARMHLTEGDSIAAMKEMKTPPDVILLDPMFPERRKSALVKKKFQLLQQLERPCPDEDGLLAAAFEARPHRLIIKRPAKGPYLGGKKPDYSIGGKSIRYDCFHFG